MDEMKKIDLIDRYLRNELSGTEKATFEQKVADYPDFRQEVEDMRISQEVIRSYAMREEIKSIRKAMLEENQSNTSTAAQPFRFYAVRIAASVLLLIVALAAFQYASLSGDKLYAEKSLVYQTETSRGAQAEGEEAQAFTYYQQEDYQRYLENYEQWTSPSTKATFLAGNAYLQSADTRKAIAAFQAVLEKNARSDQKQFQDDAEYYLSLALVKNEDYAQALSILESIADNPAHKYHNMADTYYLWKLRMMQWKAS